jgi:hypothetical protein
MLRLEIVLTGIDVLFAFIKYRGIKSRVSGHVTLSCNQWRNTAFHLYVVYAIFKGYSYVKKIFFVYKLSIDWPLEDEFLKAPSGQLIKTRNAFKYKFKM